MRQFDRIVVDYQTLGGLPHFRETTVTVSEVVRMVMDGRPNDDILAQYPDLQPGDIQDALAFALQDLMRGLSEWVFEHREVTGSIGGYALLLTTRDSQLADLSEENRHKFAEKIQEDTQKARGIWERFHAQARVAYGPQQSYQDEIEWLWHILENVRPYSDYHKTETVVDFNIQKKLPPIYSKGMLSRALSNLIYDCPFAPLVNHIVFDVNIIHTDSTLFKIRHNFKESFDFSGLNQLLHWGGSITTAALIIHQHGSELKITPDDEGVTFSFELPLWHDE